MHLPHPEEDPLPPSSPNAANTQNTRERRSTIISVPKLVKISYSDDWKLLSRDIIITVGVCLFLTLVVLLGQSSPQQYSLKLKPNLMKGTNETVESTRDIIEYQPYPLMEIWLIQFPRTMCIPLVLFFSSQLILEVVE